MNELVESVLAIGMPKMEEKYNETFKNKKLEYIIYPSLNKSTFGSYLLLIVKFIKVNK